MASIHSRGITMLMLSTKIAAKATPLRRTSRRRLLAQKSSFTVSIEALLFEVAFVVHPTIELELHQGHQQDHHEQQPSQGRSVSEVEEPECFLVDVQHVIQGRVGGRTVSAR